MNRRLLSLFASLLIVSLPQMFLAQNDSRRQVPITPLRQITAQFRTPTMPNSRLIDQMRVVVRDREAWNNLWHQMIGNVGPDYPPLPEIDFSREMLIVAAMGSQPSSGYSIIIEAVYTKDGTYYEAFVRNNNRTKCKGIGHFPAITSPVDIVRLPRSNYSVMFREIEDTSCGPLASPTTPNSRGH